MREEIADLTDQETQKKFEAACEKCSDFFDEEEFVNENILPLWKKVHDLCAERAIPVLFTICYANNEESASSSSGMVLPGKRAPAFMHKIAEKLHGNSSGEISFTRDEIFEALKGLKSLGRITKAMGQ